MHRLAFRSLSSRLIAFVVGIVALCCAGLSAFNLYQQTRLIDTATEREMAAQQAAIEVAINYEGRTALAASLTVANLAPVRAAFAAGDRAALQALLRPGFGVVRRR